MLYKGVDGARMGVWGGVGGVTFALSSLRKDFDGGVE